MTVVDLLLLTASVILFGLAAFWRPVSAPRVDLIALGLLCWVMTAWLHALDAVM